MYMKYTVEISADTRKDTGISTWQRKMQVLASEHGCVDQYTMHEMEGVNRRVVVSECVQTVLFDEESLHNMLSLLERVRGERLGHVDCVYSEGDGPATILFASAKYIRRMPKAEGIAFRRERKKRTVIDEDEALVLKALRRTT
jgi:hypothetical protein